MLVRILTSISLLVALASCQSLPAGEELAGTVDAVKPMATAPVSADIDDRQVEATPPPVVPPAELWERIRRGLSWQSIHNSDIGRARDSYLRQHNFIPVIADRARLYLHYIVEEVEKRGLPMEIALLPVVESLLDPFATSPERAAGLWQIMPATGRHLGIQTDWWYDGRRDLRESTRIALNYLEALHTRFDEDWLLALAAYNSGKSRVGRARAANEKKGLPTDYWSLSLPRETRHYVPRLIALTQIIASPDAFDVDLPTLPNEPAFEIADTGGQIEMARAADLAAIDRNLLRALNPGQLRWATSPDAAPELLLPAGAAQKFSLGVAQLTADDRVRWQHYKIRRGDNLIAIAKKFDTEVGLLRQVNGIRGSMIRAGDELMIPMGSAWASSLAMADETGRPATARDYRVRRGDSLYRIAGRFKVSVRDIISWNSLDPDDYLQPGQQLTLYPGGG